MTIQASRNGTIRVRRPSSLPYALARLVRERGQEPRDIVAEAIGRHPTFAAAALELGVDERTLRDWRKRLRIEVA